MKYSQWIGVAAVLLLAIACFMPWAYFPDLNEEFTGLYSKNNAYGKPGKILIFLGILQLVCFLLPKIWAKRANILTSALALSYALRSFIVFSHCYGGVCPEKRIGLFLMGIASILAMVMALLPDLKLKEEKADQA